MERATVEAFTEHMKRCLDASLDIDNPWGPNISPRGLSLEPDYLYSTPFNLTKLEEKYHKFRLEEKRQRIQLDVMGSYFGRVETSPPPMPNTPELSTAAWCVLHFMCTFSHRIYTSDCTVYCGVLVQQRVFQYLFGRYSEEDNKTLSLLFSRLKKGRYLRVIKGPRAYKGSLWQPNPFLVDPYPLPPLRLEGGE